MIWYVAIGSAAGGVARFLLGGLIHRVSPGSFPLGTLLINVTGSMLLGFLMRYSAEGVPHSAELRVMLTSGFCAGYTTYSTFSLEALSLFQQGDLRRGLWYIVLSVVLSLTAALAGMGLAGQVLAIRRAG